MAETEDFLLNRFGVPRDAVTEIIALPRRQEIAELPDPLPAIEIRDSEDLAVVAAAIGSHADFLVTGDKDITSIAPLQQMRIATPPGQPILPQICITNPPVAQIDRERKVPSATENILLQGRRDILNRRWSPDSRPGGPPRDQHWSGE